MPAVTPSPPKWKRDAKSVHSQHPQRRVEASEEECADVGEGMVRLTSVVNSVDLDAESSTQVASMDELDMSSTIVDEEQAGAHINGAPRSLSSPERMGAQECGEHATSASVRSIGSLHGADSIAAIDPHPLLPQAEGTPPGIDDGNLVQMESVLKVSTPTPRHQRNTQGRHFEGLLVGGQAGGPNTGSQEDESNGMANDCSSNVPQNQLTEELQFARNPPDSDVEHTTAGPAEIPRPPTPPMPRDHSSNEGQVESESADLSQPQLLAIAQNGHMEESGQSDTPRSELDHAAPDMPDDPDKGKVRWVMPSIHPFEREDIVSVRYAHRDIGNEPRQSILRRRITLGISNRGCKKKANSGRKTSASRRGRRQRRSKQKQVVYFDEDSDDDESSEPQAAKSVPSSNEDAAKETSCESKRRAETNTGQELCADGSKPSVYQNTLQETGSEDPECTVDRQSQEESVFDSRDSTEQDPIQAGGRERNFIDDQLESNASRRDADVSGEDETCKVRDEAGVVAVESAGNSVINEPNDTSNDEPNDEQNDEQSDKRREGEEGLRVGESPPVSDNLPDCVTANLAVTVLTHDLVDSVGVAGPVIRDHARDSPNEGMNVGSGIRCQEIEVPLAIGEDSLGKDADIQGELSTKELPAEGDASILGASLTSMGHTEVLTPAEGETLKETSCREASQANDVGIAGTLSVDDNACSYPTPASEDDSLVRKGGNDEPGFLLSVDFPNSHDERERRESTLDKEADLHSQEHDEKARDMSGERTNCNVVSPSESKSDNKTREDERNTDDVEEEDYYCPLLSRKSGADDDSDEWTPSLVEEALSKNKRDSPGNQKRKVNTFRPSKRGKYRKSPLSKEDAGLAFPGDKGLRLANTTSDNAKQVHDRQSQSRASGRMKRKQYFMSDENLMSLPENEIGQEANARTMSPREQRRAPGIKGTFKSIDEFDPPGDQDGGKSKRRRSVANARRQQRHPYKARATSETEYLSDSSLSHESDLCNESLLTQGGTRLKSAGRSSQVQRSQTQSDLRTKSACRVMQISMNGLFGFAHNGVMPIEKDRRRPKVTKNRSVRQKARTSRAIVSVLEQLPPPS